MDLEAAYATSQSRRQIGFLAFICLILASVFLVGSLINANGADPLPPAGIKDQGQRTVKSSYRGTSHAALIANAN